MASFVALVALASACVSKGKHEGVVAKLGECNKDRDAAILKANKLEKQNTKLSDDNESLEAKLKTHLDETRQLRAGFETKLQTTRIELKALRQLRAAAEKRAARFRKLSKQFKKMISAGKLRVYWRHGRMIVGMPSRVLFPSGKATLSAWGMRTLAQVAHGLKEMKGRRFIVAGHTDNVPIGKALFADNWELAAMRALHVVRFLVEKGMNPRNLAAAGYGMHDPIRGNYNAWGRQQNRRIELVLVPVIPNPK
jgi:chemotaxis protein MotB